MFKSKKVPSIKTLRRTNRKLQALIKKEMMLNECLRLNEALKYELDTVKNNNVQHVLGCL